MLDYQHRIARIHQLLQNINQPVHIRSVKAGGRLVQHIDGAACEGPGQLCGQLHPLGFAAGQRGTGLAQLHISQTHVYHGLGFFADFGDVLEELHCFLGGHVQHLGNVLTLVLHLQGLPVIPLAMAHLTGHVHIRQEMHFDFHQAVAVTGLAPAALYIEGEAARAVAPHFGIGCGSKQIPDVIEQPRIGSGVGPGGSADRALVNVDNLVQMLQSLNAFAGAGAGSGVVQLGSQGFVQHLANQAGLAGAGNAGDAGQGSQGDFHIQILQVVLRGSQNFQGFAVPGSPMGGYGDFLYPGQVLSCHRPGFPADVLQRARRHNLTAVASGAGAYIHNKVRLPHGILVMLHHNEGIAQIPELFQGHKQLVIVTLVKADGRLVQNIQNACQRRANLGSQSDTLALAAGQGSGGPGQGQVLQTHIHQKAQAGFDLPDNLLGNNRHVPFQLEILHEFQLIPDTHGAKIHNAHATHGHSQGNVRQSLAFTHRAGSGGHTFLQLFPGSVGLGFPEAAADVVQDALEGLLQHTHAVAPVIGHTDFFSLGAVKNHIQRLFGKLLHRNGQGKVIFLGQGFKIHPEYRVGSGAVPAGGLNGTLEDGFVLIGNHQLRVGNQPEAQAGTGGAGTCRVVEREHPGFQLRHTDAAVLTGVVLGKAQLLILVRQVDHHQSAGMGAGGFDGVRQTAALPLPDYQPVYHQLDGMLLVLFTGDGLVQIVLNPVHPDTDKAALSGILKDLGMLTLLPPNHRRIDNEAGSLSQGLDPVHNLVHRLPLDFLAALGAMGRTGSGPEEPEIVVNLRHRAHGGTGVLGGGFLVDGDGRGQSVNGIHVRLVHLAQKLTGVSAQALHIPPLALCVNGIKSQTGFSRTGKPGKHHHFVSGDGQIHIFQVILSGSSNYNSVLHRLLLFSYTLPYSIPQPPWFHKNNLRQWTTVP